MAWSTPKTWVFGELVTAASMNVYIRDNMNYLNAQFGSWQPVPFNSGNFFTDQPSLWIVAANNIQQNQYQAYDNCLLLWSFSCSATRLTAPATYLYIQSPVSGLWTFSSSEQVDRTAYVDSFPAPAVECLCRPSTGNVFRIQRIDGLQFTAGTNLGVYFNVFMRVR